MKVCQKCVLPETYPGIKFDQQGICQFCLQGELENKDTQQNNFKNEEELIQCMEKRRNHGSHGKYDVLVPISGGIDSCFTLVTIVKKYKLRALGFHNDHGYEDETATQNVRNLCKVLGVDLVLLQQEIEFMKKLWKYTNEAYTNELNTCYVCGNVLFLNALEVADRFDIPMVINGYSKGQAAMTNDKEKGSDFLEKIIQILEKTGDKEFFNQFMDKYKILTRKKDYQTREDLENPPDPEEILFVPFYVFEFYKTDKTALREQVAKVFDWQPIKTSYPNCTTNCEIVWLNCYMDREKMGYSLYEIEYSELVRQGEFTREQALSDLDFKPPAGLVERLAHEVGVDIHQFKKQQDSPKISKTWQKSQEKNIKVDFDF